AVAVPVVELVLLRLQHALDLVVDHPSDVVACRLPVQRRDEVHERAHASEAGAGCAGAAPTSSAARRATPPAVRPYFAIISACEPSSAVKTSGKPSRPNGTPPRPASISVSATRLPRP